MDAAESVGEAALASSARLSADIAALVSRAVGGQDVDLETEAGTLSSRYPDLRMSADMINSAILRAIGMVGAIRQEPDLPDCDTAAAPEPEAARAAPTLMVSDSEIELTAVLGEPAEPILMPVPIDRELEARARPIDPPGFIEELELAEAVAPGLRRRSLAAVRRVLFRR